MRAILWSLTLSIFLLRLAPARAFETRVGVPFDEGGAMRVAFDAAGNVVAAGYTHMSGDLAVATVVKLDPAGAVLWRTDVDPLGSFVQSLFLMTGGPTRVVV
jgi:hypothetical protein